ncbi:MAG: LysM peptidoglycan-binding domain-containing protein [Acidobacteria bacterium]|nr:LysM peptidoglycan-binding domain-containing protein [Acidobacteriota bacterium]
MTTEKKSPSTIQATYHKPFRNIILYSGCVLFTFAILVHVGCAPRKLSTTIPVPVKPVLPPDQTPTQIKIEEISAIYRNGKMYADIGYTDDARQKFDLAVASVFNQDPDIRQSKEFESFSETLVHNVHSIEMQWIQKGDSYTESSQSEQANAILSEKFTFLSQKEADNERKLVEDTPVKYEIPVVLNNQVLSYIKAFSTRLKPVIEASLNRGAKYEKLFKQIFREEGVPEDLFYLPIIESGYRTRALSHAKAKGIWQFMAGTARLEGLTVNWWIDERCDPEKATRAAARHLKRLHNYYGDWYLALAAYNAGQGKVDRSIRKAKTRDFWKIARHRWIFRRETRNYVPGFLAAMVIGKNPEKYELNNLEQKEPISYDTVTVDSCTDLRIIAKLSGTTVNRIQELNPQLRRLTTPITKKSFAIHIPAGQADSFTARFDQLPKDKRVTLRYHRIRPGQTLSQIARKFQTSVSAIQKANNIRNVRKVRAGKTLVIPIGQGHDYYYRAARDFTVRKPRFPRGKRIVHRVHRGDTLFGIALRYRTDVKSVRKWNNLDDNLLHPGQKLTVYYSRSIMRKPVSAPKAVSKPIPSGFHRIKPGETLYSLSKKYGVSIKNLKKWNKIRSSLIHPGDLLRVENI